MNDLQALKDALSLVAYGKTAREAIPAGLCIDCGKPAIPKCTTEAGLREYSISGICEECWDTMFGKEMDPDD